MPQTAEHVLPARQVGVDHLVVALDKADAGDEELTGLVELEIRDLLDRHGYPGSDVPVVRVSGLRAPEGDPRWTGAVQGLLDAVDTYVPMPERYIDLGEATVARPGETVTMTVELGRGVPLEPGLGFAVREGSRTVGAGTVQEVLG